MSRVLKILFFGLLIKPVVLLVLGLNVRNRAALPKHGPAVIAANHNSHLDTMVLMSLYPLSVIHRLRPVAAADYFLRTPWLAWFSLQVIGIIPLRRGATLEREQMFAACHTALDRGDILILFPEGTRGTPEAMAPIKKGIYHLLKDRPGIPVSPVVLHGLGRALPKGEALLVPYNCDVIVGDALRLQGDSQEFIAKLASEYSRLLEYCVTRAREA